MMEFCFEKIDILAWSNVTAVIPGQRVKTASMKMEIGTFFMVWGGCGDVRRKV